MYWTTMTLLLRASSTGAGTQPEISSQCFQAARQCLQAHLQCYSSYEESGIVPKSDYANGQVLPASRNRIISNHIAYRKPGFY